MAVHTIPANVQADLKVAMLANYEIILRDFAGNVLSLVRTRADHPSYGTSKTQIRYAHQRLEGAIGAYAVLAGQSAHPFIPLLATFLSDDTRDLVDRARAAVETL